MPFTVRNSRDALKHVDVMQALKGRKFLTPFPEYMIYMFYSIPESVYFHNLLTEFADGGFERNFSHFHKTICNRKSSAFSSRSSHFVREILPVISCCRMPSTLTHCL